MKLKNKIAIVTGGGTGIGKAIAVEMAKEGAKVVVSGLHVEQCQEVVEEIAKLGGEAIAIGCDVSKQKDVDAMIKETIKKFKQIDILVNNAGILVQKPLAETTEEDFDKTMNVNLKGVFLCSKAVTPGMIKRKKGKIVSIASIAGKVGFPNLSAYCSSKAAIINLTREMALELAPYNINVNAIAPGVIETAMTKDMLADKAQKAGLLASTPLGRAGKPEEIAKAAVYLVSDDSDFVVGHTLVVDGGWLAH
jgi:NAD(P)-dependent dehydrogenase (short-subunit alcohol dehydrogenase family)